MRQLRQGTANESALFEICLKCIGVSDEAVETFWRALHASTDAKLRGWRTEVAIVEDLIIKTGDEAILERFFMYTWCPLRLVDATERLYHERKLSRREANQIQNTVLEQTRRGGWKGAVTLEGDTRHVQVSRADYMGRDRKEHAA